MHRYCNTFGYKVSYLELRGMRFQGLTAKKPCLVTAGQVIEFSISSSLLQLLFPFQGLFGKLYVAHLAQGLTRGLAMLAIGAIPYLLLRRRHFNRMSPA